MQLIDYFPSDKVPRISQKTIIDKIEKVIGKKKFIIIQAPTGSGKSYIPSTLAGYSNDPDSFFVHLADTHQLYTHSVGGGFEFEEEISALPSFGCAVLTVSKSLQNQYDSIFKETNILKGKQNYACKVDNDFDCDLAPCHITHSLLEKCIKSDNCTFLNARRDALKSKFGVFNYSSYLSLPAFLQKRQIIVCDEASELEDELVKYYSCNINYKRIKFDKLNLPKLLVDDIGHGYRWLVDLVNTLKTKQESLSVLFNKHKNNKRLLMSAVIELRLYRNIYEKLLLILQNWYATEYIIELNKDEVTFTPLYVNQLANNFFKNADTVVLMSGTIIDHSTFAKTLGIKDYEYIEVDSEFDSSHSPIYCLEKYKLNYKNLDKLLPEVVQIAEQICNKYPKEKGIIHTHTFKITQALQKKVRSNKRFLLREPGITNEYLVSAHKMSTEGTVLISPSLGFGTDLADEFGRFSIIMKVPYLPLGNKRIKILAERNWNWYQMKALINLVQMCGRTTRNKDDYSDTYILDGTAVELIKKNNNILPLYFKKRIH